MNLWDGQTGRRMILDVLKRYDREQLRRMLTKYQEALRLTEELERMEGDFAAGSTADGFVERASVDDSTTGDEGKRIATPAAQARNDSGDLEPARNDSGNREQASDAEEQKDFYSVLPAKARDYVRSAERNLLDGICQALSVPGF